jgi:hypothetical protein
MLSGVTKVFVLCLSCALVACLVACRVELEENEEAQLTLGWTCLYRVGQALQCPGRVAATFKDKSARFVVKSLHIREKTIASGALKLALTAAINNLGPIQAVKCAEMTGDGICHLVRVVNKDKLRVSGMPNARTAARAKKGQSFPVRISASTHLLNEGSSSSERSSN